ncbi:MAG: hypothetical protein ABEI77_03085 [Halorientalis sp.]
MESSRLVAVAAIAVVAVVAIGSGGYTSSLLSDSTTAPVAVRAPDNLTADVGPLSVEPSPIETDRSNPVLLTVQLSDPGRVEADQFRLELPGREESLDSVSVECDGEQSGTGNCTATFSGSRLTDALGEPGTYEVVLRGWWDFKRDFRARGTVTLVDPDQPSANTTTSTTRSSSPTTTSQSTTTQSTTSATTTVTTSQTSTTATTTTETPTPTPTPTATPTPTPTPTPTATQTQTTQTTTK